MQFQPHVVSCFINIARGKNKKVYNGEYIQIREVRIDLQYISIMSINNTAHEQ